MTMFLPLVASADVEINETNFPDEVFRNYLLSKDFGSDMVITDEELQTITSISVSSNRDVKDMKGIEFFIALKTLDCRYNKDLQSLDLSNNTALTQLYCERCGLTSLDLSKNTALTTVTCFDNQLTSLNVTGCTALKKFHCYNNQIVSLNFSGCAVLTDLRCNNNRLTSLVLSSCNKLELLYCEDNQLSSLDLSESTALQSLKCGNNQLSSLDVSHCEELILLSCGKNQLASLSVAKNTKLQTLYCYDNSLQGLDLLQNTVLKTLYIYGNQIHDEAMDNLIESVSSEVSGKLVRILYSTSDGNVCTKAQVAAWHDKGWSVEYYYDGEWKYYIGYDPDITGIPVDEEHFPDKVFRDRVKYLTESTGYILTDQLIQETTVFSIYQCEAESLKGIEYFTNLINLTINQCQLKELDLSANTKLKELDCNYNQLTTLNVSGCTDLVKLSAEGNQLTAIDLSKNTKLESVYLSKNQFSELDLNQNVKLKLLCCNSNQLTSLGLRFCEELSELSCQDNQIISLNVSDNTQLTVLNCINNQLTQLNVRVNTALKKLACNDNLLTELDVTENPALITLECGNNQLASLDVSQNTGLALLTCYSNQLTSLDVSKCKDLYYLSCYSNKIVGKEMDNLIAGLPKDPIPPFGSEAGVFRVLYLPDDGNVCTPGQVSATLERGWTPYFTDHKDIDDRDVWLKYTPSFPTVSGGAGTKGSPYLIKTADDLDKFAADVKSGLRYINTYFSLDNDIDYTGNTFSSIGNEYDRVFCGVFDGQGHVISNMKCSSSLFASTDGAEIMNVTLGESCEFRKGGIVTICAGGSITGCVSYALINSNTSDGTGGIVSKIGNYYDESVTTITSCKNYGKVSGSYYTGGIVGLIVGFAVLSECVNEGVVTGTSIGTGGIAGSASDNTTITMCFNRGTVEGGTAEYMGSHRNQTGGIAGISYGTVSYCDNEDMVRGYYEIGGIVGQNEGVVNHCNNKADVEANGGIVGANYGTISNCRNTGNVIIENNVTGAIIGYGNNENLNDNYYTENVITSGYDSKRYSGAVSRGAYDGSSYPYDIEENNGAILESVTLDAQQQGDGYWTTFFKNRGNYQADENTKVYTARMVSEKVDGTVRHTLLLKEVPDRIILGKYGEYHGVLLKSSKDKITLTYTPEAGSEDAYKDNVLSGADYSRYKNTYETCLLLTIGEEFGFSLFDGEELPANTAFVEDSSSFVYIREPMMGDVTGDGMADAADIVMILADFIIGNKPLSDNPAADVNGDGVVNVSDIVMLISLTR